MVPNFFLEEEELNEKQNENKDNFEGQEEEEDLKTDFKDNSIEGYSALTRFRLGTLHLPDKLSLRISEYLKGTCGLK